MLPTAPTAFWRRERGSNGGIFKGVSGPAGANAFGRRRQSMPLGARGR